MVETVTKSSAEGSVPTCRPVAEMSARNGQAVPRAVATGLQTASLETEFLHSGLERRSLHSQPRGRPVWTTDHPVCFLEGTEDVFAFSGFQSRYIAGRRCRGWLPQL